MTARCRRGKGGQIPRQWRRTRRSYVYNGFDGLINQEPPGRARRGYPALDGPLDNARWSEEDGEQDTSLSMVIW